MKIHPIKQKELIQTALQEKDHNFKPIEIENLIPGIYDNVTISIKDGCHCLMIPQNMDRLKFKLWKISSSGIFSRDLLRKIKGKSIGEWIKIKSKNYKTIIRLIKENELEEFENLSLIHGKIKDSYYMHLKTLNIDKNIRWSSGYIEENKKTLNLEEENKEISEIIPTGKPNKLEDEENPNPHTETLF